VVEINRSCGSNIECADYNAAKYSGKSGVLAGHPTAGVTFDFSEGRCEHIHAVLVHLTTVIKTTNPVL